MIYTDEFLNTLITCPKKIVKAPSKSMKLEHGYLRTDFDVQSEDGQYNYECFIRVNEKFMENFSIGINFFPADEPGSIPLLRCNGSHGPHKVYDHHNFCHIHRATAETITKGLKPESNIETTEEYTSYQEAIAYFLKLTHIKEGIQYFPTDQFELFKK